MSWATVVIAATGPSFDQQQVEMLNIWRAKRDNDSYTGRLVAVNDAFKRLPQADLIYAHDHPWWKLNIDAARRHGAELWSQDVRSVKEFGVNGTGRGKGQGLNREPMTINMGANSGYGAMNLAYHLGARKIILVGFDCQKTNGRKHYFGDHPYPLSQTHSYATWRQHFDKLAPDLAAEGVDVVNCSKQTAIESFRLAALADELA